MLGGNVRAVYICEPKGDENVEWSKDNGFKYPLVVFCHGYLGNWQLFQGIWKDLDNCIVLSIGTRNLSGIFTPSNLKEIFDFYIPALERMGYNIDREQLHLMGLSNGGSAIVSAMHSSYAKKFRSITTVSCNLEGLKRVPCQVNFIGGGKDKSSCRMPEQCRQLKAMGVDAGIFFKDDENHFIMVNKREEIIEFLKDRMQLKCVNDDDVPYKEHKDIVAITGLDDFPSYTYSHNEKHTDIWSGRKYVAIYFNFNKELSSEYIKKMKALCNDKDNVH